METFTNRGAIGLLSSDLEAGAQLAIETFWRLALCHGDLGMQEDTGERRDLAAQLTEAARKAMEVAEVLHGAYRQVWQNYNMGDGGTDERLAKRIAGVGDRYAFMEFATEKGVR